MNKKSISYGMALVVLCLASSQSFSSMHTIVFRSAQIAGAGYCLYSGAKMAYDKNKQYKRIVNFDESDKEFCKNFKSHMPLIVQEWARDRMKKLRIPDYQSIPLLVLNRQEQCGWFSYADRAIVSSSNEIDALAEALQYKQPSLDQYNELIKIRATLEQNLNIINKPIGLLRPLKYSKDDLVQLDKDIKMCKKIVDTYDETIALNNVILMHELNHHVNKDVQAEIYALACMPLIVQIGSSSLTYGVNKLLKIKPPKTVFKTILRSSSAISSIGPKLFFSTLGLSFYNRLQETKADRFANENSKKKIEVEVFRNFFQTMAAKFEEDLLKAPQELIHSPLSISQALTFVVASEGASYFQQQLDKAEIENFGNVDNLKRKKDTFIRFAHAAVDQEHPYHSDRAAMAQEYLDQWDQKHSIVDGVRQ